MSRITSEAPTDGRVSDGIAGEAAAPDEPAVSKPRARRSLWVPVLSYVATVFMLITLNFALPRLMPGDPIDALMALGSPERVQNDQTRAELVEYYHLDQSIPEQYGHYLGGLARGDLGTSIASNSPVTKELGDRVGWSFLLMVTGMLISIAIGLPAGIHSGWNRSKRADRNLLGLFLTLQNLPVYLVGAAVFAVFAAKYGLFPLGKATTPFGGYSGFGQLLDIGRHLILPGLLLGLDFATYEFLVMRSSMVSELGSDYLLVGRAKGLKERRLKYRYAGRNALLPVITVVGLQFSVAITSIIFIERIFAYPGVGGYMFEAIGTRDYPAMQGAFLVLTITVVTVNLVVDLVYRRLDPRTATQ